MCLHVTENTTSTNVDELENILEEYNSVLLLRPFNFIWHVQSDVKSYTDSL